MNIDNKSYKIAAAHISHERVGVDVVILDLELGHYYSTTGVGTVAWEFLVAGCGQRECAELLSRRFPTIPLSKIGLDLSTFVKSCLDFGLIVEGELIEGRVNIEDPCGEVELEYVAPEIKRYTDLEDLLRIDPIHEVTPEGWPVKS